LTKALIDQQFHLRQLQQIPGNTTLASCIQLLSLMRMGPTQDRNTAFTRIELLVVGLILLVLVGVLLPGVAQKKRSTQLAGCLGNLKQVILAELLWINDNEKGQLTWRVSTNDGGTFEHLERGKLSPHFKALSNELVSTKILTCPADNRESAKSLSTLTDSNLSYFMNMKDFPWGCGRIFEFGPEIIFGDRNITNNTAPQAGILTLTTSNYTSLGWDTGMHNHRGKLSRTSIGNLAYYDGSVATAMPTNLHQGLKPNCDSNRLALP
jgi:hypothetical protein